MPGDGRLGPLRRQLSRRAGGAHRFALALEVAHCSHPATCASCSAQFKLTKPVPMTSQAFCFRGSCERKTSRADQIISAGMRTHTGTTTTVGIDGMNIVAIHSALTMVTNTTAFSFLEASIGLHS